MTICTTFIRKIVSLFVICTCLAACDSGEPDVPAEEITLLKKVYQDEQLYLDIFYDKQHRINRIDYYQESGEIKSRREIHLDEQGRVIQVISDFGHYVSTRNLTYEKGRKVLDEATYVFKAGGPRTYGKRAWRYPAMNVIEDLLYADDLETVSYIHTFTFSESGNVERKERNDLLLPAQNSYTEYDYDTGLSYEFMIESNIPGYSEIPIARNQLLTEKIFTPAGELITEVQFRNTYDEKGNLVAYRSESAAGNEDFRFEYQTVAK